MGLQKIHQELKAGHPVIISATKQIVGHLKFHMVVLTGLEENENGSLAGFYFNDPESLYPELGKDLFVTIADFKKSWRRMAIFIG